jgi:superfamily I DNA/RNA helicase
MVLVTSDFYKKIHIQDREFIMKKLEYFKKNIEQVKGKLNYVPKGFWIRKIKGTDIFKFRLNNSDRILFTFVENKFKQIYNEEGTDILFLSYSSHDNQINRGKNLNKNKAIDNSQEFNINKNELQEDEAQEENKLISSYIKENKLDLSETISFVVEDEYVSILIDENNEDYLYYLSDEQFKCINYNDNPMIVTGGAGSGKTTVCLHKLRLCLKNNLNVAYITYSNLLCEEVERLFNNFNNNQNTFPNFYFLKKYYQETLDINYKYIVKYPQFNEWINKSKFKYKKIMKLDNYNIWSEIRGILKGYMGFEYAESQCLFQRENELLELKKYLSIPFDYSSFNEEEKIAIYKLTLDYQLWLKENKLYDECDLAKIVINKIGEGIIPKYDYLIIDEVQDLSEIELYMLSLLVKKSSNIMLSGDIHQIINPNFFKFGRVKNLYHSYNLHAKEYKLIKNFRNNIEIVKLLNRIIMEKRRKIGATSYDFEQSGIRKGNNPFLINPDNNNIKFILENIKDKHYAVIIVSNNREKEALINTNREAEGRIFTLSEVKGLEYDTVICYNLISSNIKQWSKIYQSDKISKDCLSKYSYYFNMLYVAISRACNNLYLYENKNKNKLIKDFFGSYEELKELNKDNLSLYYKSSESDWRKEASRLEKMEVMDKAQLARNIAEEEKIKKLNYLADKAIENIYPDVEYNTYDENMKSEELLKNGFECYQKMQFVESLKLFEKALELEPENPEIYYKIANVYCYMFEGKETALNYYNHAIKIKPNLYLAYLDKSAVLRSLKRYDEYEEVLMKAIEINPHNGKAYDMLATGYIDKREMDKAIQCYQKSIAYDTYVFDSDNRIWTQTEKNSDMWCEEYKRIFDMINNLKVLLPLNKESKIHNLINNVFVDIIYNPLVNIQQEINGALNGIWDKTQNTVDFNQWLIENIGYYKQCEKSIIDKLCNYVENYSDVKEDTISVDISILEHIVISNKSSWLRKYELAYAKKETEAIVYEYSKLYIRYSILLGDSITPIFGNIGIIEDISNCAKEFINIYSIYLDKYCRNLCNRMLVK